MLELIDTHAHLDAEQFAADLPAVLTRAAVAGVAQMIAVATTADSSARCVALAETSPALFATVGIHPNEIVKEGTDCWEKVLALVGHPRVVGVGETGLDRHWNDTPFAVQEEHFARHLELGRRVGKTVVIHCREAEPDTLRMLRADFEKHGPIRAVMHSFAGARETAEACLEMGLYLSFAGMLTYKNAGALREVAAKVPLDRVMVETDCPYLAPVPLRGKRNEPANVAHTLACLAGLHGVTAEEMAERTTRNARGLFGLPG